MKSFNLRGRNFLSKKPGYLILKEVWLAGTCVGQQARDIPWVVAMVPHWCIPSPDSRMCSGSGSGSGGGGGAWYVRYVGRLEGFLGFGRLSDEQAS